MTLRQQKRLGARTREQQIHVLSLLLFVGFYSASNMQTSGCNTNQADVIFLLDSSASVGKENFQIEKQFILNFTKAVVIGPTEVQVGIVKYALFPKSEIKLNSSNNGIDLRYAIQNITYEPGLTKTNQALKYVYEQGYTKQAGDRSYAPDFLVVLTDGLSTYGQATIIEAERLHSKGVTVYAIGIGNQINTTELVRIATDKNHMFVVANYDALHQIQSELHPIACNNNPATTTATIPPMSYTVPPDPCSSSPCIYGHCFHDAVTYVCMCQPGYHGKNCDQDLCSGGPCKNGGHCYHSSNDYICICKAGFSGKNCENGFCTSQPCYNGGQCFEDSVGYICICQGGYTGDRCDGLTTTVNPVVTTWILIPGVGRR